jgi:transcriptional regulator with XRE-family HTH domain
MAREGRRVTQADVAEGSNVKLSTLQKWESGAQVPHGENLLLIARFYGVPPEHILSGAPAAAEGGVDADASRTLLETAADLRALADELERRAGKQTGPSGKPGPAQEATGGEEGRLEGVVDRSVAEVKRRRGERRTG